MWEKCSLAGRVIDVHKVGKKITFYTIKSGKEELQVMAHYKYYSNYRESDFFKDIKVICLGDHVGVHGFPAMSKIGKLTLVSEIIHLLAPCKRFLGGFRSNVNEKIFSSKEERQKYFDSLDDCKSHVKTKLYLVIWKFFNRENYLEVSAPVKVRNRAAAKSLSLLHSDLKINLYNRGSADLKEAFVCNDKDLQQVFQIRNEFRNKSLDNSNSQDLNVCEAYCVYSEYTCMMHLTEKILTIISKQFVSEYNLKPPFRKVEMVPELEKQMGVKLPEPQKLHTQESKLKLIEICKKFSVNCPEPQTTAKMLEKLCYHFIVKKLKQPTFIMYHPLVMSPLAKESNSQPGIAERFQLYIGKMEIVNGYTQQNDPEVQREAFRRQEGERDVEEVKYDEDYCKMLEYGLPPCAGLGLSVDRLLTLLKSSTNNGSLL